MADEVIPILRACYAKTGLLRMVAHRDLTTQLRRLFLRARLPLRWTEGFNPKPRFSLAPPLPLGVEAEADWIDVELACELSPEEFIARTAGQCPEGLRFLEARQAVRKGSPLEALLPYAAWRLEPWDPDGAADRLERLLSVVDEQELWLERRNKKGRLRRKDVRPRIASVEPCEGGVRAVLAASNGAPDGPLGLFDFLRLVFPDQEDHPLTVFRATREGFLRRDGDELVPAPAG